NRWAMAFLCAAVLLPPLPIALGDSGPHPCLVLAALGLAIGLLRSREWRVPGDELGRALLVLFFVLLASPAPSGFYSGLGVGARTTGARAALRDFVVPFFLRD